MSPSKYMTFREFADYYFRSLEERKTRFNGNNWGPLKVTNIYEKQRMLNQHVHPFIGNIDLKDFDMFTNRILISNLKRKGISQGYIYQIVMNTKNILTDAFCLGLIDKSIIDSFHVTYNFTPNFYKYTNEELNAICNASLRIKNAIMFPLALLTGMERKEILALRWNDLGLKDKSLSINRYIGKEKGSLEKAFIQATDNKHRRIYLGDKAWKLLAHQYSIEFPGQKLNDSPSLPDSLIFHRANGKSRFMNYEPKEIIKKLRKESGIQTIRFNYLRRYYSVAATKATNDMVGVNKLMGYQTSDSLSPIEPYINNVTRGVRI